MVTPSFAVIALAAAVLGLALGSLAALKGWHAWLQLRREQLISGAGASPALRPDLAELKDRVRKLERIALGVDL